MKRACQVSCFSLGPGCITRPTNQITLYFAMCVSALKSKRMGQSRGNLAFTSNGFKNWKDATITFKNHGASANHKEALQVVMVLRKFASGANEKFSWPDQS